MTDVASAASGVESGYGGLISQMKKNDAKSDAANEGYIKKIEDTNVPSAPNVPPAPEPHQSDPLNGFGSAATWLATFGSMLTRRPLTNALNATADVMDAHKTQDATNFKQKWDKWKAETEGAWKMAEWNQQLYKDAIGKTEAEQKITASSTKNRTLEMAIQAKMAESYHKDFIRQVKQGNEAKDKMKSFVEEGVANEKKRWIENGHSADSFDENAAYLRKVGEAKNITSGKDASKEDKAKPSISQETADFAADVYLAGNQSALSNYGRGEKATANLSMIHDAVTKRAKEKGISGADLAKIDAEFAGLKAEKTAIGRRAGTTEVGVGEFDQLIGPTKESLAKLDLTHFKDLNSFKNYASEHTDNPDLAEAVTNLQELQNAYTAVLTRGGVRTDAAQHQSEELINKNFGPDASVRVLDTMAENTKRIMTGIEKAKSGTVGKNVGDKETPLPKPADNKYLVGKYYDLSAEGHGTHKYLGNGEFE